MIRIILLFFTLLLANHDGNYRAAGERMAKLQGADCGGAVRGVIETTRPVYADLA